MAVVLSGEFDLSTSKQLVRTFETVLPACARLVIDLNDVDFLESATIRVLVNAAKAADALGVASRSSSLRDRSSNGYSR